MTSLDSLHGWSIQTLLRGENDSKRSDEFQAINNIHKMEKNSSLTTLLTGEFCTALYDYEAADDDELTFSSSDRIEILSKEFEVSGDEDWWVGRVEGQPRIGLFPSNYITTFTDDGRRSSLGEPLEIDFQEIDLIDLIGVGAFGKVYPQAYHPLLVGAVVD